MRNKHKKALIYAAVLAVIIPGLLILGISVWDSRRYYVVSLLITVVAAALFFARFERRLPAAREIVILSVMTAIAVASRLVFFMLPQFKPIAAVVIIAGIAFGAETGFMCGSLSMLISNMTLGAGPWMPWQMFGLGLVGFLAGLLFGGEKRRPLWLVTSYGFLSVMLIYGFLVDTYAVFGFMAEVTWPAALAAYAAGLPFNAVFAFCTALTLLAIARPVLKKIDRVKMKYGIE